MRKDSQGHSIQVGSFSSNQPSTINLSVSSANVGPLKAGIVYRLWSSVDCFFLPGATNAVSAGVFSHPLKAGLDTLHLLDYNNTYIAGVVASGTGVLYISELDTVS